VFSEAYLEIGSVFVSDRATVFHRVYLSIK
jgi:hypothetical protein